MQDIFLKAETEADFMAALSAAGMTYMDELGFERPKTSDQTYALDIVGTISKGGEFDEEGNEIVAPTVTPGFHANIRLINRDLPEELAPFVITVEQPVRVWA